MPTVRVEIEDYDDDSESVSKEKEIINVAHFVPDTRKNRNRFERRVDRTWDREFA